jgi:pyruvate formate lyase activating enzyme
LRCRFCQNADIAQMPNDHKGRIMGDTVTPQQVVAAADKSGCRSIAYTYTEPTVFFEFAYDTAKIAHDRGIRNVFVTNGYMTAEALEMIDPYLDAANVDLKAFRDRYYKDLCGARLGHVQDTLRRMKARGIFVEVTTLIVTGLNDDTEELEELAAFIADDLGTDTPWHISRFHPTYQLTDRAATPVQTLTQARKIGLAGGLKYVYTGNVPGNSGENTFCPGCGEVVIERWGFQVGAMQIKDDRCTRCSAKVDGVWN